MFIRNAQLAPKEGADLESYPFTIPAIQGVRDGIEFHKKCTFLIGENGMGKSTLLEALAVRFGFNAEGGTKNFRFSTRESHSELHKHLWVDRGSIRPIDGFFLRAESFFNVATEIEKLDEDAPGVPKISWSYGDKPLHEQSHGESFFSLFLKRFGDQSFFILDEPEAALSPSRQMAFLVRLHDLIGESCQFIIATHSPIIMAYPDAWIYQLSESGIDRVDYEETEHVSLTKRFLNGRERMLEQLLGPMDENPDGQKRFSET